MATFLSSRVKNLKVGIPGYTDGTEVAGFIGNVDIDGEISVSTFNDGGSTGLTNYVIAADGSGGWSWQSIGAVGAVTSPGGADGQVQYNNNGSMSGASVFYYDDVNNRVGIGTSSPGYLFEVNGDASFLGNIRDKDGDVGVFGQILMSTGTGVDWVNAAPADAITGLNIYEEGTLQGGANAVSSLDFRGSYITATVVGSTSTITMNESPNFTGLTINSNTVWHAGNDGTGSGLDADLLDGQQGTYYLDYTNFTNKPTIGNAVITIAAGVGMTGGGDFTTNQTIAETITITHADTSTQASVNNSNGVVIQDITLDGFGHITALGSIDLDGRYYTETEADARFLGINAKATDSDLLDGQDSTYYLNTSVTTQTKSGGLNVSGNLGVGTTSPSTKFHVVGDSTFTSNVSIGSVIDIIPYDTLNNGTLSFEGSAGQLFSITNNLTSGSIFSVNDVSGLPSLDIDADGTIVLAEFGGNVGVGTSTPGDKLDVVGSIRASSQLVSSVATGTAPLLVSSSTIVTNLNADLLDGQHGSYYLDWANVTNKPDPVVTVTLTGDVTGSANAIWTDFISGTINISTTIPANSIVLGTDTSGDYLENVTAGTGITISGTKGEGWTATIAHADTSTQTSVNNINGTVIQDITLDGFGHITDIESINLDLRYLGIGAKAADSDLLDGQDGSYYLNTSTTFGGDVSGTYNAIVVANDSHTHDTRYYTETESDARFLGINAKAADSDLLDGQDGSYYLNTATVFGGDVSGTYDAIVVANDSHTHDGRYYTEAESDARFLGINAKAADANLFDGIDSGSFLRSDVDDTFDGNLTLTGELRGPATFVIDPAAIGDNTGKVIIRGDFQVDGTTTTINSTTLTVDDKSIVVASGAGTAAAADGAGISVDGANATITYSSSGDSWVFNKAPYYSTNRILTTADEGEGNGLDADTLDGQQGSYYLNASNINAGTIGDAYLPATISSDITGNAATATKLATARSISLAGDVTGSVSFDGSANVSITATVANDSHTHDGRYYTEAESDARFLGISAKAADSNLLDGIDSGSFLRSDTADNWNVGRGDVYFENNSSDNADGAGITLRTSSNPSSTGGAIFAVRSSGQAARLWVGQDVTSTGYNPLYVGTSDPVNALSTPYILLPTSGNITRGGNTVWDSGNDGSGSGLDADLLDGQQGTYYLDYNNFTNKPTIGNGTLTVQGSSGLTGSGTFTANQTTNATITVSHADTSNIANLTASSRTYVTALTFDGFGHVTGYSTGTETVVDTNTTYGISAETTTGGANLRITGSDASTDDVKFAQGGSITISRTDANTITISGTNTTYSAGAGLTLTGTVFSHTDTSSQASVDNANGTVIQDITLDTFGHITAIGSVDLDTRYLGISAKAADSNLLDGIDSGSFLRSDTADSASGIIKFLNYTQFGPDPSDTGSTTPDSSGNAAYFVSRGVDQDDSRSNVIRLMRDGTSGVIYAGAAAFDMDRWEASSVNARTRLHLSLAHSSSLSSMVDVMSWRSDGLVQIVGNTTWHAGNDGSGSGLDADLLDGQQGTYYLDYNNFSNTPTIGNGTLTVTTGGGLSGSGTFTANQTTNATITVSHADTSSVNNLTASSRTYVTALTFDTYGHVTGYSTGTETVVDTNTTYGISAETVTGGANLRLTGSDASTDDVKFSQGANITITRTDANTITIAGTNTTYSAGAGLTLTGTVFSHTDTSSQASIDNTNGTVIQDITLDTFGHITAIGSINLDGRYYTEAEADGRFLGINAKASDSHLLDGIDSGSFLRSDANDSFSGNLTNAGNNYITFGPNSTWGNYLRIGGNGYQGASGVANIATTNGNLHLDAAPTSVTYLNHYAGTAGVAFGNGASAAVAWMGPDGDLWKGSSDNTGSKYWHAGNDGSGSGLDADLLDGQQGSYYLNTSTTFGGDVSGTYNAIVVANDSHTHDGRYYTEAESDARFLGISAKAADSNLLDGIDSESFLRSDADDSFSGTITGTSDGTNPVFIIDGNGPNIVRFLDNSSATTGIDLVFRTTPNTLGFEKSTDGTNLWQTDCDTGVTNFDYTPTVSGSNTIWHAGNDGSGSGLDADLLDGAQPSVSASNNTIVQRHSSGYIYANYFNTSPNDVTSGVTKVLVETGDDGFMRHGTPDAIRSFINVESGATADQSASEILTAIKTVDGAGSGLDADLLDGQQASAFINSTHTSTSATNRAVGWYTVAVNSGNRAVARFGIRDTTGSRHQSCVFYASHHFGANSEITVLHSGRYSGTPFRYIRIKEGGTFDGALLQVYVDDATNALTFYLLGDNFQDSGWVIKNWVADGTDPGGVSNFAALTNVAAQVDLDQIMDGGMVTTGNIYAGGKTSQSLLIGLGNDGSGSGLDADLLDGQQGSYYLNTGATTQTKSGGLNVSGNVGIGTTNPGYKLEVNGSFAATTKSFVIPHPTKPDHKLRYGSLEGPENGIYVRGRSKEFVIELPEYWTKLADSDSITVNLTPIGKSQTLWVKDIKDNRIYVGSKCSEVNYFYTIFAERADVEKLEVEFPIG